MESLKELLKLTSSVKYDGFRLNKDKKPNKFKCLNCDPDYQGEIDWFWLESECIELMPSHWERHMCKCQALYICRSRRNYLTNALKIDEQRAENKMSTDQRMKINSNIETINKLIKAIKELKNNEDYYLNRFNLADDLTSFKSEEEAEIIWQLLFCGKDKAESGFYVKLLDLSRDKEVDNVKRFSI